MAAQLGSLSGNSLGDGATREPQAIMRIYVGNLSFKTNEQDLRALFSNHGEVTDGHIPSDRETGRSRGFAVVTMVTPKP